MITGFSRPDKPTDPTQIHCLFCGTMYFGMRSPQYFLDIISRLDSRFHITFMGKNCADIPQKFHITSDASLTFLPEKGFKEAQDALKQADVLINIGNSVPVHMPSKTLEYINTGKPIVNIYKRDDCPTLYFTKRYPLCLNLYESTDNIDDAAKQFIRFCEHTKGSFLSEEWVQKEYADCTPKYIAEKIESDLLSLLPHTQPPVSFE
ncbi:MAG: hypothetical protein IJU16_06645 [Clostridia bacterium]|nr:hypothetical protein [Clostridia bacterium]